jgi:hypothetical protein
VSPKRGAALVLGCALALLLVLGGAVSAAPMRHGELRAGVGTAPKIASRAPARRSNAGPSRAPATRSNAGPSRAPATRSNAAPSVATAPSGPPLTSPGEAGGAEGAAGVPSTEGDQLVENGLSSPLCGGASASALSSAAQSNCQTSGFVGGPAPTNNYDLDVNIDTGALGLGNGQLLSVIQDVFVAPIWEGLVWLMRALVVMLQWCYALELLGGSTTSGLRSSLGEAQASFTEPWLALVLAASSVLALYNGLIRRRVGETLGQALLTIAMMALGLWLIADPLGTVGTVGQFANQASLGTLGAVAQGTTADAPRTLGDSMRALFADAIEAPWCYLEFGDVRWCSDPAMLEPRLRKAAANLIASEQAKLGCQQTSAESRCRSSEEGSALAVEHASELVRGADTNGALFLAFPANGPERNSAKASDSLLHVLCQSENDGKCEGATAAQAEFRSGGGTFPRMLGVVLIAVGVLGMAMLFGLIAIHLLASALLSLFMLLLAPFAVLVPALGDTGRALFSGWLTRLLGSVCSKLVFSFLLGALLTMQRMLTSLQQLGWWTQWLLISAFWWVVFCKRHQALAFVRSGGRAPAVPSRHTLGQGIQGARQAKQDISHPVRWAKRKLLSPLPEDEGLDKPERGRRGPGQRPPAQTVAAQQRIAGKQQRGGAERRQEGNTHELPGRQRSEYAGTVERIDSDGEHAGQTGEETTAAEPWPAVPRDQVGSTAPVHAGNSRRDRARAKKPTRPERAARLVAHASDPEYDEAAWLAGARHSRVRAQQPVQQQQPVRQQSPAQQRPQQQSPPRAAAESAATAPSSRPPGRGGPNSRGTRIRTSREIMDDAREVAAGRKRQLGLEPLTEGELEP